MRRYIFIFALLVPFSVFAEKAGQQEEHMYILSSEEVKLFDAYRQLGMPGASESSLICQFPPSWVFEGCAVIFYAYDRNEWICFRAEEPPLVHPC